MSLGLKETKTSSPIAVICGGKYDGEIVYKDDKEGRDHIKLNNAHFELLPKSDGRFIDYVVGKSGSGKSTLCSKKAKYYHMMYPDNDIYLFSRVDEDDAFKEMEKKGIIKRIKIDQSIIEEPIDVLNEFEDCLCIFDDVDTFADNRLMKAIDNIRDQIMQLGRHKNVSLMNCSHNVSNTGAGMKITRTIMNELHHLIFFNKSCNYHQIKYCLKKYFGLVDTQIDSIVKNKGTRWTCISSDHPQYVMTEDLVYLLN